jgi:cytochrome c oxidase cbb3-type subunit 2
MPPYTFLAKKTLKFDGIEDDLKTQRLIGVPYTDDMIASAKTDLIAQASPNADYDAEDALIARYEAASGRKGTLRISDYDQNPAEITEMDALIAYLQMTGTLVDFSTYEAGDLNNRR